MIRTPPGKVSIDGASRFRLDVTWSLSPPSGIASKTTRGLFLCRQFNFSSICGRFGRPPFFPFSLDAFRLAAEVFPAEALPPFHPATRLASSGVMGIVLAGSFSCGVSVICGVSTPIAVGCQPVFSILPLSEYAPLYQGAPTLPPTPLRGKGAGHGARSASGFPSRSVDGSGFRASENSFPATSPPRIGFESAKGGCTFMGKGLENGPRRLYAPR